MKFIKNLKIDKYHRSFIVLVVVILFSSITAFFIQNDFGKIDVKTIKIVDENGNTIVGKLYRPLQATEANPLPGVLLLHGLNNDMDTEGGAALELARRGFVTLALSELGHGDSVSYGQPVGMDVLYGETGAMGANEAYQYLQDLPFVNARRIGLVGHSMGGTNAILVALANPDHWAIVIQAGGPQDLKALGGCLHNYLQIWPRYEEFVAESRSDFITKGMAQIEENTGETAVLEKIYGSFSKKTAQKYVLIESTHPGGTWNAISISETCDWMVRALKGGIIDLGAPIPSQQTYQLKEAFMLIALVAAILSTLPLASILLKTKTFKDIVQPIPVRVFNEGHSWWKAASINSAIGGASFIVLPMLGLIIGLLIPFFMLKTANGSLIWLLINALICWILFKRWYKKTKKTDKITSYEVGVSFDVEKKVYNPEILLKTVILTGILFFYLYTVVSVSQSVLDIEFRYNWAVLKMFNGIRLGQFLLYLLPILPFFLINGGIFLFGQIRQKECESSIKTFVIWWIKVVFAMEFGLFVVFLINYIPMLFGTAAIFGNMYIVLYMIFAMQVLPQFALIFFVMTYFYRKTGKIYLGAFMATILTTWIMAVSSVCG
ncbi:MAG: alpha/beta hydrolase [Promethearchaeota archaeon]